MSVSLGRFALFVMLASIGISLGWSTHRVPVSYAQSASSTTELQGQIDQTNQKIAQLQKEITQLQSQLTTTAKQRQTLQSAIAALQLNIKKLQKSISLTQTQIQQKNNQISVLSGDIQITNVKINNAQSQVADSLRQLNQLDSTPLSVAILSGSTLSSVFDQATTLSSLRTGLEGQITNLSSLQTTLQTNKAATVQKKQQLTSLQQNLSQQQVGITVTLDTQSQLLKATKNKESVYQAQIAQKKSEEAQFESDLLKFEASLHLNVNPTSLPPSGSEPLRWPLDSIRITQYFGNTPFATQNPQIYSGHGHTGIDLAASPGTPVHAARSGVVLGTGNTDLVCKGASFGKWVFIKHDDGLETMYAHLSIIGVSQGQSVSTGDVIGYSDTTGYATGPHLHFGVYASAGSKIASFPSRGCGGYFTMPVADLTAYLNPLSFLPPIP